MIPLAAVRWSSACVGFALCRPRDENRIGRSALIIFWVAVDAIEALTSISKDVFHGFNVMVARSEKQAAASCDLEPALTAFRSQFLPVHTGSFGPEGEDARQVNDAVGDEFQGRQNS